MKKFIIAIVSFSPLVAFAQYTAAPVTDATSLGSKITSLFNVAIDVLMALAVLWIIVSVVVWLVSSGSEGAAKWRNNALWGIVGLAIILSIWGLVHLLTGTAGLGNNRIQVGDIPQVPVVNYNQPSLLSPVCKPVKYDLKHRPIDYSDADY